ncbi:IS3 family transposase [Allobranchiibius sp. GilTou73]|uniref:IS3 family transposase n=1 Tax=Allobranchiibius sp. GilTou73 TaxID=2904523 RepID=UPI001F2A0270|nr:IS3 family transposase [Allobranchiibius sp. GilTou73]UIJ35081.1 IS3 family transposase [Allobranchiibius sp. GilTou73]UIJ35616.1 IS3 family transposase [Allobranchiibius sp. GilTou73]UIJ35618.1 IS3 family transposase [Allobranchiibius sp. GilTou73]UIJ35997.1 IS3 family transposase [Allobranchiibius sp. GilTou73]UIJ36226.1 IS3 family transposase [Allobranchiibius sp. GilTou73]
MPKPYPIEFREDVVRVARAREAGVTLAQVAKDFGIHEMTLTKWLRTADVEDGNRPGTTRAERVELRDARRRIRTLEQENEVLRRAAAYLSQANLPKRLYPLVKELAAHGVPVTVSLRVLKLSRAPYYRWRTAPVTGGEVAWAYRANALFDAHRDDPVFGYRYLHEEAGDAGHQMSSRTAWAICSANTWWSVFGKRRSSRPRPGPPVHDDRLAFQDAKGRTRHDFTTAEDLNCVWLTDITEHWTTEGKLYLCAIKDACSGRIVGYSIDSRMTSKLAVTALNSAVARRATASADVAGCVVHSDRGSQFRSRRYVHALARHELVGSMGRVGACGDNAAMESFFALLQKNVLNTRRWDTREQLRIAIVTWIERTYHRRRRQDRLGRLTPIEYETTMTPTANLAA